MTTEIVTIRISVAEIGSKLEGLPIYEAADGFYYTERALKAVIPAPAVKLYGSIVNIKHHFDATGFDVEVETI